MTSPFDVHAVFTVYMAADIAMGYSSFAHELVSGESRVVGFVGHLYPSAVVALEEVKETPPNKKKGVFMVTCLSAQEYAALTVRQDIVGLLFNTQFIAPEGYILLPLFAGVLRGASGKTVIDSVRAGYQVYHPETSIPRGFFVNSSYGLEPYLYLK